MTLAIERIEMAPPRIGGAVKFLRMAHVRCNATASFSVQRRSDGAVALEVSTASGDLDRATEPGPVDVGLFALAEDLWDDLDRPGTTAARRSMGAYPELAHQLSTHLSMERDGMGAGHVLAVRVPVPPGGPVTAALLGVLSLDAIGPDRRRTELLQGVARRFGAYLGAVDEMFGADDAPVPPPTPAPAGPRSTGPRRPGAPAEMDDHTGLPTLGPLIDQVESLASRDGLGVSVVMVDMVPPGPDGPEVSPLLVELAAATVRTDIRHDDFVAQVAPTTFAVAMGQPVDRDGSPVAERRLVVALRQMLARAEAGGPASAPVVRSASAFSASHRPGSEAAAAAQLVHDAWARLRSL